MSIISELVEGGKRSEVEDHHWLFNKFEASLPPPISSKGERYLTAEGKAMWTFYWKLEEARGACAKCTPE